VSGCINEFISADQRKVGDYRATFDQFRYNFTSGFSGSQYAAIVSPTAADGIDVTVLPARRGFCTKAECAWILATVPMDTANFATSTLWNGLCHIFHCGNNS